MKIQFDSSLDYQKDAIRAITEIFQGQEICEANFTVYSPEFLAKQQNIAFNEIGYGNEKQTGQLHKTDRTMKMSDSFLFNV